MHRYFPEHAPGGGGAVIRRFRMTDAPCQLLQGRLNSRDLVYTRASIGHGTRKLTRVAAACYSMSNGPGRKVLGSFENGWLESLVIVQTRKAASAWEVVGFFASSRGYSQLDELLIAAAAAVGESGGERLFLRCAAEGAACGPAQRAGFNLAYSEELFTGRLRATQGTPMHFRPVKAGDTHDVFRLQMATGPRRREDGDRPDHKRMDGFQGTGAGKDPGVRMRY